MKRLLLEFCFWVNIFVYLILIVLFIEMVANTQIISHFLNNGQISDYRMLLNIPILVLWIYNIIIWAKKDKKTLRLILIIFLNGFYNTIYYRMAVKKNWIV